MSKVIRFEPKFDPTLIQTIYDNYEWSSKLTLDDIKRIVWLLEHDKTMQEILEEKIEILVHFAITEYLDNIKPKMGAKA